MNLPQTRSQVCLFSTEEQRACFCHCLSAYLPTGTAGLRNPPLSRSCTHNQIMTLHSLWAQIMISQQDSRQKTCYIQTRQPVLRIHLITREQTSYGINQSVLGQGSNRQWTLTRESWLWQAVGVDHSKFLQRQWWRALTAFFGKRSSQHPAIPDSQEPKRDDS